VSDRFAEIVAQLHEASVILRKPECRGFFLTFCAQPIATRFAFDFRILEFLKRNWEVASSILDGVIDEAILDV
jgi:hypothetical protein